MEKKQIRPFGVKDEIGYVFGDMAGSFVNLFVDAYFLIFCTNVLGISAGWMGTLFLVARLWDAINDPIMGSFPDRWMIGKSGDKFKPWIKIFMLPLALSGVLCFFNVPLEGIALHAYVAFAYVLYGMSYTGTSMPFGAMASVVSDDPIQRSKLSRARSIGGTIVGIVGLSIVPVVCFDKQSNILPERFTLIAVIFGVLSIISYFVLLNFTQERIRQNSEKAEKFNYGKVLKATVHNRPLIGVMVATLGSMLFITGSNQVRSYIFKEYYARTDVMSIISLATIPILVICFPLVPKLVAKFGKKATLMAAIVSSTIFSVIPVVMEIKNVYIYSALVVLGTIGQTVFTMLIWALVTDCLDYSEWKFNERSDGSMYSLYTFSRKIGSTIASTGVSFGLAAIGFVSGSNVVQTAEAVNGIYFLVNIIPVVTCALELIGVGLIFNLNKETTEQMYAELKAK
ncbi:MFS transporter [Mediterraneibacter gnavus]|jgi:GPH family glycoside/pentoside/hexuronide:cation symporter|uniref:MFS transporter n=1 Tax=Mediterraneibacter gnavus TaxID=33038 RepID=A0A2N5PZI3_MEDGN|nr:MFS transporter [Mediterraneibacter gnavus]MDU6437489.1 MFS transporter [Lachnospiraceae bacterium]PLT86335.1 MFS transporter [Mediterraneibacter gnavus]